GTDQRDGSMTSLLIARDRPKTSARWTRRRRSSWRSALEVAGLVGSKGRCAVDACDRGAAARAAVDPGCGGDRARRQVPPGLGIPRRRAGAVAAGPDNSDLDELTRTPRACQRSTR